MHTLYLTLESPQWNVLHDEINSDDLIEFLSDPKISLMQFGDVDNLSKLISEVKRQLPNSLIHLNSIGISFKSCDDFDELFFKLVLIHPINLLTDISNNISDSTISDLSLSFAKVKKGIGKYYSKEFGDVVQVKSNKYKLEYIGEDNRINQVLI